MIAYLQSVPDWARVLIVFGYAGLLLLLRFKGPKVWAWVLFRRHVRYLGWRTGWQDVARRRRSGL